MSTATRGSGPRGKAAKVLALASRPNGASREELNKLTKWQGAPWKWLLSNPHRSGYCDRWGYRLRITRDEDGVRYRVTKR